MLGRHEDGLVASHQAVKTLASQMADLTKQFLLLQADSSRPSDTTTLEPRVNNPPPVMRWDGLVSGEQQYTA
ncbi:hypothetical protein F2P79_019100 [Pimephales promelas]|nr:hypothetical protein F2P79_019100 [Pimephales promelas]